MFLLLNSELIVRWARNFYDFTENELATVELVTDSKFETNVTITGNPRRIPDSDPTHREPLLVLGPQLFPGNGKSKMNDAALHIMLLYTLVLIQLSLLLHVHSTGVISIFPIERAFFLGNILGKAQVTCMVNVLYTHALMNLQ